MKNIILKSVLFVSTLSVLLFSSCYDAGSEFAAANTNKKAAPDPNASALFAAGQFELVDLLLNANQNRNIFRLTAQYWTQTDYTDESNYDFTTRAIPDNVWDIMYRDVLYRFKLSRDALLSEKEVASDNPQALQDEKKNKLAVINFMNAYVFSVLVETFGDIPYTEALQGSGNVLPKYDTAANVVNALIDSIDVALTATQNTKEVPSFGASDIVYGGDMIKWRKFANSLKLRLAMLLVDVEPSKAKKMAEEAFNAGCFSSNADNATVTYGVAPPNTNPLWVDLVQSNRRDYVGTDTFISYLDTTADPRLAIYFAEIRRDTLATSPALVIKKYYTGQKAGKGADASIYSQPSAYIKKPDLPGVFFAYADVLFYLAEAKEKGFSVTETVEKYYTDAIQASLDEWGVSAADATAYLAQPKVAFATAIGANNLAKIALQKWISLYGRPFDAWTEIRRLDVPKLVLPEGQDSYPNRLPYPRNEQTRNGASYRDAVSKMNEGDKLSSKLFWDKN